MQRFFFDVVIGSSVEKDIFGFDMENVEEARLQALALVADVFKDASIDTIQSSYACEVRSQAGDIAFSVRIDLKETYSDVCHRSIASRLSGYLS